MIEMDKPIIISGPCAAESWQQVHESALEAQVRGIDTLRMSLWKPRTRHPEGVFLGIARTTELNGQPVDGLKLGLEWIVEVAKMGLRPATEVMTPKHAEQVINAVESEQSLKGRERLLIWLGSRNQNDDIQMEIGEIVAGRPWVQLMLKNQMWSEGDKIEHWLGIVEHVRAGGLRDDQLLLCHRGFAPGGNGLRNTPDWEKAMRVKLETGLPMLTDPSHMGGTVPGVFDIARQAARYRGPQDQSFDGYVIEVHPNPQVAKTDQKQQLTWSQYDEIANELGIENREKVAA